MSELVCRNACCPCGSGKKFKRCCRRAGAAARRGAAGWGADRYRAGVSPRPAANSVAGTRDVEPEPGMWNRFEWGNGSFGEILWARSRRWFRQRRAVLDRLASEPVPTSASEWRVVLVCAESGERRVDVAMWQTARWVEGYAVAAGEAVEVVIPSERFRATGRVTGIAVPHEAPGVSGPWGRVEWSRVGGPARGPSAPIESIRVGEHVATHERPESGAHDVGELDSALRYEVVLWYDHGDGSWADIVLLRDAEWVRLSGARPGGHVELDLPEMGVRGEAAVVSVEPRLVVWRRGRGRQVTGTFRHSAGDVGELHIRGEPEPLGVTAHHRIWSADRVEWVEACELERGESVEVWGGLGTVEAYTPGVSVEPVYNLEVEEDHCYRVGQQGILVHNASDDPWLIGENEYGRVIPFSEQKTPPSGGSYRIYRPRNVGGVAFDIDRNREWTRVRIREVQCGDAKLYDIGGDPARTPPSSMPTDPLLQSPYHHGEVTLLRAAMLVMRYIHWYRFTPNILVSGMWVPAGAQEQTNLYEWIQPP